MNICTCMLKHELSDCAFNTNQSLYANVIYLYVSACVVWCIYVCVCLLRNVGREKKTPTEAAMSEEALKIDRDKIENT